MLDSIILAINTKSIPLTQGKYAIVDADNYEWLMQWKWSYRDGYAKRSVHIPMAAGLRKQVPITMHGVILPPCNGLVPDHINGNGLDNRRENLRLATQQQNMWNRKPVKNSSSKYKGVSWRKSTGYWIANIKLDGKQKHLGCFWSEEDAARAYNKAAKEMHGEFAKLNDVEDGLCLTKLPPRW